MSDLMIGVCTSCLCSILYICTTRICGDLERIAKAIEERKENERTD